MATYLGRIQHLVNTAPNWASINPVLMRGEFAVADVDASAPIIKIGDGTRPWSALPNLLAPVNVANDYIVGTVDTLPPGSDATLTIDNTVDPPTLSMGIPSGDTGPANSLAIGTVTTGPPGGAAAASITGAPPNQTLNLTIPAGVQGPQGIQGIQGPIGPANSLAIGTVATGSPAAATITGTPPNQTLNLTLPPGPPNALAIGTVSTLAPGTPATATITGTPPNQTLNLGIPQGATGDTGGLLTGDSHVTGDWAFDPTQFFGFTQTEVAQLKANSSAQIWTASDSWQTEQIAKMTRLGNAPVLTLQRVNGGYDATTKILNNEDFGWLDFRGSQDANALMGSGVRVIARAAADWSATSSPGQLFIYCTPVGSLVPAQVVFFSAAEVRINQPVRSVYNAGQLPLSNPQLSVCAPSNGNSLEFGHANVAGYRSTLGNFTSNGRPFVAFNAEHGTTANTFRTRGIVGRILQADLGGGLVIGRATAANADDQTLTVDATIDANGAAWFHQSAVRLEGATSPRYYLRVTGAPADEGRWGLRASGRTLDLAAWNDAENVATAALSIVRDVGATTISSLNLLAPTILTQGGQALSIKAGATSDHVYMAFYADSAAQATRSAYVGYGGAGSDNFEINLAQGNGNIALSPAGTGLVRHYRSGVSVCDIGDRGGAGAVVIIGTAANCHFMYGVNEHVYIRQGKTTGSIYIGDIQHSGVVIGAAGYPTTMYSDVTFANDGVITDQIRSRSNVNFKLRYNNATSWGTWVIDGGNAGYVGIVLNDGVKNPHFMSNGTTMGVYVPSIDWVWSSTGSGISSASFTSTSSRAIKRETGTPHGVREILARLRPIFYRLLKDESREQLGLIAEEVAEVCPQLSDGKTVAYDRLALLLLADWQARFA